MSWLKKYSRKDRLRKPGEHWYALEDLFDPKGIRTVEKGAHIMGRLDDVVIVQVPRDTNAAAAQSLYNRLAAAGIHSPAFAVTEDVKFLKLRALSMLEEKAIDNDLQKLRESGPPESDGGTHGLA